MVKTGDGEKGTVTIAESNPSTEGENQGIQMEWRHPASKNLTIEKVSGYAYGVGVSCNRIGDFYLGAFLSIYPKLVLF